MATRTGRTMLDKIWDQHVIARISDDTDLLHVDRHLLHDLGGSRGLLDLKSRGLKVHSPELTFATPDHAISTALGRSGTIEIGQELLASLRTETTASGIRLFDVGQPGQGIVHVIGPELGLSLPGCVIVCGDSHTCTHGGLGALAFGIGSSELTHVLATQALIQRRPKTMRVNLDGKLAFGVSAKDLILAVIGYIGAAGVPLIFDLIVYQVLIYYFHVWYPIAFAISALVGATMEHYGRKDLGTLPWSRRALIILADGADCYLINIGLIMLIVSFLHRHATVGRALAAGAITLLAFMRQNLLAMQRRHLLIVAEQKVLS